ncbi:MAG: antibiotic biosynthesis monooxygenase family protein [Bacteroidia bacterium]
MNKYGLHGKLQAKAGSGDELTDILLEAAKMLRAAKGCQLYVIGKDKDDPDALWITEIWDTREDHDNSLKDQAVRALITRAIPLLDGPPAKGQELQVLGGFGIS